MAIAKILGIETEYGISVGAPDVDPITTSTLLVNAYASQLRHHIGWDFHDESPGRDARGAPKADSLAPLVETHLANAVLTNGARFYVDHAHPEYSSPECASPLEGVLYDVAGEHVLRWAMEAAQNRYPESPPIVVYKNNSDSKGNSYGCHENYLMNRTVAFADVIEAMVPHLVTRQLYCGAGKVGAETSVFKKPPTFQISQRAEFFEEVVGLETTLKRPIVNTRDEPHADPQRFRRLHVIIGDANMSQVATFLKLGTTALVLAMLEDGALSRRTIALREPIKALRQISRDLAMTKTVELGDGTSTTALGIQEVLLEAATSYVEDGGGEAIGDEEQVAQIIERWKATLEALATDPDSLAHQVDWIAKKRLLEAYADRHGLAWTDPRLRAMDLQYHDLRPERSLASRLGLEELIETEAAVAAATEPPRSTRAWFRGMCLQQFPDQVVTANWDSLVFDLGEDPLRRVPMMDPLKGTAAMTEELLGSVSSARQLLARLDA